MSISAPLTGGPIKTAKAERPIPMPMYVPMFLGSLVHDDIAADALEMIVPETKPKKTAYTMMPPFVVGSLMQKTITPVAMPENANILM